MTHTPATPPGGEDAWVLVPREPTEAMLAASNREWDGRMSARSAGVWQAMLAAAPEPPLDRSPLVEEMAKALEASDQLIAKLEREWCIEHTLYDGRESEVVCHENLRVLAKFRARESAP